MEEDAGKNIHDSRTDASLVDLNRAGVPLLEIVSEPDIRRAEEAGSYLRTLRAILRYLEICDGNMEEGSFRCDANISVRPEGTASLGTKTELKNLNSFKAVEKALEYEIQRHVETLPTVGSWSKKPGFGIRAGEIRGPCGTKSSPPDNGYFPNPAYCPLVMTQ